MLNPSDLSQNKRGCSPTGVEEPWKNVLLDISRRKAVEGGLAWLFPRSVYLRCTSGVPSGVPSAYLRCTFGVPLLCLRRTFRVLWGEIQTSEVGVSFWIYYHIFFPLRQRIVHVSVRHDGSNIQCPLYHRSASLFYHSEPTKCPTLPSWQRLLLTPMPLSPLTNPRLPYYSSSMFHPPHVIGNSSIHSGVLTPPPSRSIRVLMPYPIGCDWPPEPILRSKERGTSTRYTLFVVININVCDIRTCAGSTTFKRRAVLNIPRRKQEENQGEKRKRKETSVRIDCIL